MVRATAKAAGQAEPTAEEKDPAFLAMQVRSLHQTINNIISANSQNVRNIQNAFGMVDVHQQVLHRIVRDLTMGVYQARRLFVEGQVSSTLSDLGPLKLREDGTLNMHSYYEECQAVANAAGQDKADQAIAFWSQGCSPEVAVKRASLGLDKAAERQEDESDQDYDVEHFGGSNGQDHHEQVTEAAQANG